MNWDETYVDLLRELRDKGQDVPTTDRGMTREILGHAFSLEDPRDRIIFNKARRFNVFQTVGQWLWMAAGRSDAGFIRYYNPGADRFSADLRQVEGAYGPRLFGVGANRQIPRSIEILKEKPTSRQVIALVYEPLFDTHRHKQENRKGEVPCTISLQFFLRDKKLHCITNMRSQSALMLLPQDVCHFTMFQEFVAASIGASLGFYRHHSGTFHYYAEKDPVKEVVDTPAPDRSEMPSLEAGDQMPTLLNTLHLEERIRVDAIDAKAQKGRRKLDTDHHMREAKKLPPFWRTLIHACIGQAAVFCEQKTVLHELTPKVEPWLRPFFRHAYELRGGEHLLDNYGLM